jgi:hypothetical protein
MKKFLIASVFLFLFISCDNNEELVDSSEQLNDLEESITTESATTESAENDEGDNVRQLGEIVDSEIVLFDEESLIAELQNVAIVQGHDVEYNQGRIVQDEETGILQYIASDADRITQTSIILIISHSLVFDPGETICTCSGCAMGCSPRRKPNGDCWCTACDTLTDRTCKKSESLPNESLQLTE